MDDNTPLESIYKGGFFKNRHKLSWRVDPVCEAIEKAFKFKSIVDVGCAIGDIVKGFQDRGYVAYGIEGSEAANPFLVTNNIKFHDLRLPLLKDEFRLFDMVLCLEVAEHIEPEYAAQFVKTLTGLGSQILVSIAPPGQGGHHHVNCREIGYWDILFDGYGFKRYDHKTRSVIEAWKPYKDKPGIKAYYHNLHFYGVAE